MSLHDILVVTLTVVCPLLFCGGFTLGRAIERSARRVVDRHAARVDPQLRRPTVPEQRGGPR
jgi:uncharacterized membrane protein